MFIFDVQVVKRRGFVHLALKTIGVHLTDHRLTECLSATRSAFESELCTSNV
jgi:hypothetical protein